MENFGCKGDAHDIAITITVGDRSRVGDMFKLPTKAVVAETTAPVNFIRIHHPSSMQVNGETVQRYCIFLAKPDSHYLNPATSTPTSCSSLGCSGSDVSTTQVQVIRGFPYPTIPASVPTMSEDFPHAAGTQLHITNHTSPVPNMIAPFGFITCSAPSLETPQQPPNSHKPCTGEHGILPLTLSTGATTTISTVPIPGTTNLCSDMLHGTTLTMAFITVDSMSHTKVSRCSHSRSSVVNKNDMS